MTRTSRSTTGRGRTPRDRQIVHEMIQGQHGVHTDPGSGQRLERLPWRDGRVRWAMFHRPLTPRQRTALQMYYLPDWYDLPRPTEAVCAEVLGISEEAFGDRLDAAERRALAEREPRWREPKGRGSDPDGVIRKILLRMWDQAYGANGRKPGHQVGEDWMPWSEWVEFTEWDEMLRERPSK